MLSRAKGSRDGLRDYVIRLDGETVGRIAEEHSVSLEVPPGEHILQLTLDWAKSPPLHVTVDQSQTLQTFCQPGPYSPWSVFFRPGHYIALDLHQAVTRDQPPMPVERFLLGVGGAVAFSVIAILALGFAGSSPSVIGGVVTVISIMWMLICMLTDIPIRRTTRGGHGKAEWGTRLEQSPVAGPGGGAP